MTDKNKLTADVIRKYRHDPVLFVRNVFHVQPEPWQIEALNKFRDTQRVCLKSAKGAGKTAFLAWCAWNFLFTRPDSKIAATSITGDNLADCLWAEMAKWRSKSEIIKFQFEWSKTRIFSKQYPENWFMSARSWPKQADAGQQADALAGIHADYAMFILDEVGGIPDAVMAAAEAALSSGKECKLVIAGNPTHLEGPLYRACTKDRAMWSVVEISGDPDNPNRSTRISPEWAREQINTYGKDNPWVQVNVFGNFPPSSINTLLGPTEVQDAMSRNLLYEGYSFAQKRIGIDVARFGSDATILFPRQGLKAMVPVVMRNARTDEIAARVMLGKQKWGSEIEFVDDTGGYGAGVIDFMLQSGATPQGVSFSGKAIDSRYFNKRSEMWFEMAAWVKRGGQLPNIPELVGDLCTPTYSFQNGKFRIEEKEQIRQRLGRSPDYGDALALTFALPDMPGMIQADGMVSTQGKYVSDYNPYAEDRM